MIKVTLESLRKILSEGRTAEDDPVISHNIIFSGTEKSCILLQISSISFQKAKKETVV